MGPGQAAHEPPQKPGRAEEPLPPRELPNVPPHQVLAANQGADLAADKRTHLLDWDPKRTIKARSRSE